MCQPSLRAGIDDAAGGHRHEGVEALEQARAVDRRNHAGLREGLRDAPQHAGLGRCVQRAGRLVEQQERAPLRGEHAARQAQTPPLAAEQVEAAFRQRRLQIAVRGREHLVEGARVQRGKEVLVGT